MLTEKEFENKIWKKYEDYMLGYNDNSFFQKDIYKQDIVDKKNIFSNLIRAIATIIIAILMGVGVVYATVNIYEKIWKNPEIIEYKEEEKITEKDKEIIITEEEAKNKAIEFLDNINIEDEVIKTEYIKYPAINKIYWKITFSKGHIIEVNAQNSKIVSYLNSTFNDIEIKAKVNEEEAIQVSDKIYNLISSDKEYVLKEITKLSTTDNSCLWQADYCKKYDGIFNDYQCIRIIFVPEVEQIKTINIFDEEFENNPIIITREEAEEIVKNKINNKTINLIKTELKIEKMNEYIYMQDNIPLEENQAYKMDISVRKVWSVEYTLMQKNYEEQFKIFVDVTTGEIVGGDMLQ